MRNTYFQFKKFLVEQERCAMKVTTDACLFGAWVARLLAADENAHTVLDAGAGTGLLSLMLAQQCEAAIDAVELEAGAAAQAEQNFVASPWSPRLRLLAGDVLDSGLELANKYDVVVSNPPFYENDLPSPSADRRMAHHDDSLPLPALLGRVRELLSEKGTFYLLLPARREAGLMALLPGFDWRVDRLCRVRAADHLAPFRIMLALSTEPGLAAITEEIVIRPDGKNYSPAFVELLKPYYLHL